MLDVFSLLNLVLIFVLLSFLLIKKDILTYLLLTEVIWITFYCILTFLGISLDIPVILASTLICLVVSGLEFGVGLLIFFLY